MMHLNKLPKCTQSNLFNVLHNRITQTHTHTHTHRCNIISHTVYILLKYICVWVNETKFYMAWFPTD